MPFAEMVAAARGGKVRDVKTAFALLLAATAPPSCHERRASGVGLRWPEIADGGGER